MDLQDLGDSEEDPRYIELSSLEAIFPEIQRVSEHDPYAISLELPVNPTKAVVVFFPAVNDGTAPGGHIEAAAGQNGETHANGPGLHAAQVVVDSHELAYLPSIHLQITLGPSYPAEEPPRVAISTTPPWLPASTVARLEGDGVRLWEEMGRDLVAFTYIDHIQQSADDVFGLVGEKGSLEIDPQHKIAILDYDIEAKRKAFNNETFDCGVCLDPKKGSACHRMLDCGHVFCVECLRDFYNNAIKEGDINSVRCLAPNCAKEREKAVGSLAAGRRRKAPRALFISPSELLQIPLEQDVVKRYVALKYKTELESDKNTIYCPRSWCNGAARSRKHKKPEGLQLSEQVSDDEGQSGSDREGEENAEGGEKAQTKPKVFQPSEELLAICEDCGFAFCSRCYQSWHGEFYRCRPRNSTEECPEDEKASLEYIKLHTTPCPTCAAPAQKTHGCNHMICYRCQTHFCYLCSTWLNPSNPYQHFNEAPGGKVTGCYQRLWELEEGDGNDVGIGFAGGRAQQPAVRQLALNVAPPVAVIEEWEEIDDEDEVAGGDDREARQRQDAAVENGGQIGVAREGPLVLRIAGGNPAARRGGPRGRGAPEERRPQQPNHPDMYEQGGGRGRGRGRGRAGRARAGRRGGGEEGPGRRGANRGVGVGDGGMAMDPAHEAWIRHFVRLALNDEEDLIMDMPDDLDAAQFPGGHFVMDDEEDGEL